MLESTKINKRDKFVKIEDIVELWDTNYNTVISNSYPSYNIFNLFNYWYNSTSFYTFYPQLRAQAPVGYKIIKENEKDESSFLHFRSVISLVSTELEPLNSKTDSRFLNVSNNGFYNIITLGNLQNDVSKWVIIPADNMNSDNSDLVCYGDRILLLNIYYKQFLTISNMYKGYISTCNNRDNACQFILQYHYPLASFKIDKLLTERENNINITENDSK